MDPGGGRAAFGARTEPPRQGVHDQPGESRLPPAVDASLPRCGRGARDGHSEGRSAPPVPQGRRDRKAPDSLVAGAVRAILRSSRLAVVRRLVRLGDARHPDQEPGGLEEDDLHPHLRRERRVLRPRAAVRSARSGRPGTGKTSPEDRRAAGVSSARAGSEAASAEGRRAASDRAWATACRWSSPRRGAAAGIVCSQVFDHTSVLQFLERVAGRQVADRNPGDQRQCVATDGVRRPDVGVPGVSRRSCGCTLPAARRLFRAGAPRAIRAHAFGLPETVG